MIYNENALYSFYFHSFRVSNQDAVYSEVFNETNMNYEMSKERTLEHPDTVDHNGDGIYADQFHV